MKGSTGFRLRVGDFRILFNETKDEIVVTDVGPRGGISGAIETVSEADAVAYLEAPTPLAFWRKYRGLTQVQLAEAVGISQPYLAQLEGGQREAMASVYSRLARELALRVDDLLVDPS